MKEVEKIKSLIANLPLSDINLGYKFLQERNFSELQLLVDSAIIIIKNNLSTSTPREEYKKIKIEALEILSMTVSNYRDQLVEDVATVDDFEEEAIDEIIEDLTDSLW